MISQDVEEKGLMPNRIQVIAGEMKNITGVR